MANRAPNLKKILISFLQNQLKDYPVIRLFVSVGKKQAWLTDSDKYHFGCNSIDELVKQKNIKNKQFDLILKEWEFDLEGERIDLSIQDYEVVLKVA